MTPQLLFVIGASGVGKTAAIEALRDRQLPGVTCYHFDSVGIPSVTAMVRDFGTPERWQEVMTHEWIARLDKEAHHLVVLEGQTRPSFIRRAPVESVHGIVLLDCEPSVRSHRLRVGRQQPHLDTPDMQYWAAYLRGQADALGLPVIDTTSLSTAEVADQLYGLAQTLPAWTTTTRISTRERFGDK